VAFCFKNRKQCPPGRSAYFYDFIHFSNNGANVAADVIVLKPYIAATDEFQRLLRAIVKCCGRKVGLPPVLQTPSMVELEAREVSMIKPWGLFIAMKFRTKKAGPCADPACVVIRLCSFQKTCSKHVKISSSCGEILFLLQLKKNNSWRYLSGLDSMRSTLSTIIGKTLY
jgi:hypothetical protein